MDKFFTTLLVLIALYVAFIGGRTFEFYHLQETNQLTTTN